MQVPKCYSIALDTVSVQVNPIHVSFFDQYS